MSYTHYCLLLYTQVFRLHVSGLFILATYLDIVAILTIAKEVVCILPLWVPMVDLDLRASAGWLQVLLQAFALNMFKLFDYCDVDILVISSSIAIHCNMM